MTRGFLQSMWIQTLLETLVGEHHVRNPLLHELADELSAASGLDVAARAALTLATDNAERMVDELFDTRVRALAELVRQRSAQA